jgi:hypothetical protein
VQERPQMFTPSKTFSYFTHPFRFRVSGAQDWRDRANKRPQDHVTCTSRPYEPNQNFSLENERQRTRAIGASHFYFPLLPPSGAARSLRLNIHGRLVFSWINIQLATLSTIFQYSYQVPPLKHFFTVSDHFFISIIYGKGEEYLIFFCLFWD